MKNLQYEAVKLDILEVIERHGVVKNTDLPALVKEESITSGFLLTVLNDLIEEKKLVSIGMITKRPKISTRSLIFAADSKLIITGKRVVALNES